MAHSLITHGQEHLFKAWPKSGEQQDGLLAGNGLAGQLANIPVSSCLGKPGHVCRIQLVGVPESCSGGVPLSLEVSLPLL